VSQNALVIGGGGINDGEGALFSAGLGDSRGGGPTGVPKVGGDNGGGAGLGSGVIGGGSSASNREATTMSVGTEGWGIVSGRANGPQTRCT
jgi:hypothetical protein